MDAYQYTRAFADGNYIMSATEYSSTYYNHGQTIVGYDNAVTDDGNVGAFKVVNSWGIEWGQAGYYWLTYEAIKEMLAFPLVYIIDLEDYQPTLLATWKFTTAPSVDTKVEVGSGSSTAPTAKVSTYFRSGTSNRLPGFMALDVSALYSKYVGGEKNYYLTLSGSTLSGTVSSFSLELYTPTYVAGSPTQIPVTSSDVPKAVPGTVTATTSAVPITVPTTPVPTTDTTPPTSRVQALPTYVRSTIVTLGVTSSDLGSGVDYMELYYRYNALGLYTKYAPSTNPTGKWTGSSISFNSADAQGQGPYQFYSVAVDMAGNRELAPTYPDASTTIDTGAPISSLAMQGTSGENGWYVTEITATITASDQWSGISSIKYRLNDGIWTQYASPISISAEGTTTLGFYAIDQAGNQGLAQSVQMKIDRTAPECAHVIEGLLGGEGHYVSPVNVTLYPSDAGSGVSQALFRVDGGNWTVFASPFQIGGDGAHFFEYYALDKAGNQGDVVRVDVLVDSTGPSVDIQTDRSPTAGWFDGPVTITLIIMDGTDSTCSVLYRLDGAQWQSYTEPLLIGQEGWHDLEYYATDQAGNQGSVGSTGFGIDSTAPECWETLSGTAGSNEYYVSRVLATISASDRGSGVYRVTYRLDGGVWSTYSTTLYFDQDGTTTLEYYATDLVGNSGEVRTRTFNIDGTAPESSIALHGTAGLNGYYVSSVSATLTGTDQGSGLSTLLYRLNGGEWTPCTGAMTISAEGAMMIDYYAVDLAGNSGAIRSLTFEIDTTDPGCAVLVSGTLDQDGYYIGAAEVSFAPSDNGSGVERVQYRLNRGAWTNYSGNMSIAAEGTTLLEFCAVDRAGNQGVVLSEHIMVRPDNSGAMVRATTDVMPVSGWFNSTVLVTLTPADELVGGDVYYSLNGGEWALYTEALAITSEGENLLEWYGEDAAGVKGETYSRRLMLDLTAPECVAYVNSMPLTGGWYASAVNVTLSSQDQGSGVSSTFFRLDGGEWQACAQQVGASGEGRHVLEFYAVDLAGNSGNEVTVEFGIDTVAPTISFLPLTEAMGDGAYLNQLLARLTAEDGGSGMRSISYRVGDQDWLPVDGDLLLQGGGVHLIECQAYDMAGNLAKFEISVEISPPTEAPGAVRDLVASITDEGVQLNWSPTESGVEERYLIYRSSGGVETLLAIIAETGYLDQDIEEGVKYDYRVVAVNSLGQGPSEKVVGLEAISDPYALSYLLYPITILAIGVAVVFFKRRYL
jgi:hypothetical protein